MGFVMTALSNTRFLCGAIVVTALAMMLWDLSEVAEGPLVLHPVDISHLLLPLLVFRYLQCLEADDQARGLIEGMLFVVVLMLAVMYTTL